MPPFGPFDLASAADEGRRKAMEPAPDAACHPQAKKVAMRSTELQMEKEKSAVEVLFEN